MSRYRAAERAAEGVGHASRSRAGCRPPARRPGRSPAGSRRTSPGRPRRSASAAIDAARSAALRRRRVTRCVAAWRRRRCGRRGRGTDGAAVPAPGEKSTRGASRSRLVGLEELAPARTRTGRRARRRGTSGSRCCTSGRCRCRPAARRRSGSRCPASSLWSSTEVLVRLQLRVGLGDREQPAERLARGCPRPRPSPPGPARRCGVARASVTASNVPRSCAA